MKIDKDVFFIKLKEGFVNLYIRETGRAASYNAKTNIVTYFDIDGKKHSKELTNETRDHMQKNISDALFEEIDANRYQGEA